MFTCLRIFFKFRVHEKVSKNKISLLVPVNQLNYSNVSDTYLLCLMTKHGFCDCRKKHGYFQIKTQAISEKEFMHQRL